MGTNPSALVILIAECAVVIGITCLITALQYRNLPDHVALHLNMDGTLGEAGYPRWTMWFVPGMQLFVAGVMTSVEPGLANHLPGFHGTLPSLIISAPCILAAVGRAQVQLLDANTSANRFSMSSFWIFFALAIGTDLLASFGVFG
jgi:hypothetical protein